MGFNKVKRPELAPAFRRNDGTTPGGGGSTVPAGSPGQIQFNAGGSPNVSGASKLLTWDDSLGMLSVGLSVSSMNLQVSSTPGGGATGYEYYVIVNFGNGKHSGNFDNGTWKSFSNGPAVLDSSHYNQLTWTDIPGAISYDVYTDQRDGTPSSIGFLATVLQGVGSFRDNGVVGDGNAVYPDSNIVGSLDLRGAIIASVLPVGGNSIYIGVNAGTPGVGPLGYYDQADSLGIGLGVLSNLDFTFGGGIFNTALGRACLESLTTGSQNVAIGATAGSSLVSGSGNIFIGVETGNPAPYGNNILSGSHNTWIGDEVGSQSGGQFDNSIALGAGVLVSAGNRAVIGNANVVDVFIGSENSLAKLHAAGIITNALTVATLPATPVAGQRAFVTDSNAAMTAGIGAILASGGSNPVPVVYDGTNWRIG